MINRQSVKRIITVPFVLTGVDRPVCTVSKTVNHYICDRCGHQFVRAGLDGFFSHLFEGCPLCGDGKEEGVSS